MSTFFTCYSNSKPKGDESPPLMANYNRLIVRLQWTSTR
nr:MAG TPA: hypothetical protein [Caudoviricetes sp.]